MLPHLPLTGDIILMNAKPSIVAAQTAARGRKCKYSHAALALNSGSYIDSLTKDGVGLRRWADLDRDMPLAAYRFQQSDHEAHQRIKIMIEHYGKKYNYALGLKKLPILSTTFSDTLFCSELIDEVYTRAELGLAEGGMIMPADLERLAANPKWSDVSEAYRRLAGVEPVIDSCDVDEIFIVTALSGKAVKEHVAQSEALTARLREMTAKIGSWQESNRRRNR